jgi:hypothetical protein
VPFILKINNKEKARDEQQATSHALAVILVTDHGAFEADRITGCYGWTG